MKGCLITLGIMVLILVICGVVVAMKWKSWAAAATILVADKAIANSGLPPAQQAQLTTEIKKLADDFANGRLTTADLERIMRGVSTGPLLPAAFVLATRQQYIEPSDMSPVEKAAALRSLQRYARGIFEKKVPTDSLQTVTASISVPTVTSTTVTSPDGTITTTDVASISTQRSIEVSTGNLHLRLKDHVTRAELDQFLAAAKQAADGAGIPDESFEPDWGLELKKAIETARKGP